MLHRLVREKRFDAEVLNHSRDKTIRISGNKVKIIISPARIQRTPYSALVQPQKSLLLKPAMLTLHFSAGLLARSRFLLAHFVASHGAAGEAVLNRVSRLTNQTPKYVLPSSRTARTVVAKGRSFSNIGLSC